MTRQKYYEFIQTYEYEIESPYEGAFDDGVEDAELLSGEVTWSADITWNESLNQYEIFKGWTDHGNNFSDAGEGPKDEEFLEDVYLFLGSEGISSEETTY